MDDLSGLSWSPNTTSSKRPPTNTGSYYSSLRHTPPLSGRSTPLSAQPSGGLSKLSGTVPSKSSTPANDSFSNLVSFTSSTSTKNLSLQEQQKRLEEQKVKQETERQKLFDAHFGTQHSQFWHTLGNGRATKDQVTSPHTYPGTEGYGAQKLSNVINKPFAGIETTGPAPSAKPADDEDDILAAFNSTAPVDASSNFPVPLDSTDGRSTPNASQALPVLKPASGSAFHDLAGHNRDGGQVVEDEDDPFGLGQMNRTRPSIVSTQANGADEDDVLGLLGKPVSELPPLTRVERSTLPTDDNNVVHPPAAVYPQDQAIAELVDMGFSAAKAKQALAKTNSGVDVQAAVGWLLSQAHEESSQKGRGRASPKGMRTQSSGRSEEPKGDRPTQKEDPRGDAAMPAWMRQESRSNSSQRRQDSRSPANAEKDAARYAADISNNLIKSVNSLWKTGAKAVAELNSDSDSNQPKWMRTAHLDGEAHRPKIRRPSKSGNEEADRKRSVGRDGASQQRPQNGVQQNSITNEALMLESGDSRPQPKTSRLPREPNSRLPPSFTSSRDQSPALKNGSTDRISSQPKFLQPQHIYDNGSKARLSRSAVEAQSSVAYVSPARRKRPAPKPAESEPDLLFDSQAVTRPPRPSTAAPTSQNSSTSQSQSSVKPSRPITPILTRPKASLRKIPPVTASVLSSFARHRHQGTEAFKLGDYSAAHSAYTSALSSLPDQHPITIIVLCNRALTRLKIGEPKAAVSDADSALSLIGPSRGEGEAIALGQNEGLKEMREFYGKALMRKAEALEQLERWDEAANVWRETVEAGHGGSASIRGRDRSEKAAGCRSRPVTRRPPPAKKAPLPMKQSAVDELSARTQKSTAPSAEAVTRLRAANAAAEKADDEKFALADSVDAKLSAWKNGKQDNLRALLGSLDTVLWPEAGWKKVGLHELVLTNKVKVVYMKGIAKVHPDKVRYLPSTPCRDLEDEDAEKADTEF